MPNHIDDPKRVTWPDWFAAAIEVVGEMLPGVLLGLVLAVLFLLYHSAGGQ